MRLYGIGGETATAILAFILDYFKKKILNKFLINFSKNPKKRCFGANLGPFCSNLVKNEFSWKKKFKYSSCLPSCQKSKKKLMSLRKMLELMDDQTDRQTDRQTAVIL